MQGKRNHIPANADILLCMGTRPEIIKMAPVYRALMELGLNAKILHTGQHDEIAHPLYEFFGVRPEFSLSLKRGKNTLAHLSSTLMAELDELMDDLQPRCVLVHGDTSSALNAALCAFYNMIPVGHVEAGLRSHSQYDPFPEEKNREIIARLATWHFAPTDVAVRNLVSEGIQMTNIHCVGNTVVDAAIWGIERLVSHVHNMPDDQADFLQLVSSEIINKKLVVVTAHRRENWDGGIANIAASIVSMAERDKGLYFVWPMHPNPAVQKMILEQIDLSGPSVAARIQTCPAVNYPTMLWLMEQAWIILTDSGGIQEEAAALNIPVVVLRRTTERPELVQAGGSVLVGTDPQTIQAAVSKLTQEKGFHSAMSRIPNPYGDGKAGAYIASILHREFVGLRRITSLAA